MSMFIKQLRQKRHELVAEGTALFEAAAAEKRGLTEIEAKQDDELAAELVSLDAQITRAEAQMARARAAGIIAPDANDAIGGRPDASKFANLGEQMKAVMAAGSPGGARDPRLIWSGPTGAGEGIGADGGFLVGTDVVPAMLTNIWTGGEIASRARRLPIGPNSNGMKMNGVDETSRANGSRWGGIQAYWTAEAGLMTASQPRFRQIAMDLEKVTALVYATDEMLADTTLLSAFINMAVPDELQFKLEDAIINGTGVGQPLGLLNSGAVITVTKEASQPAATLQTENILKMWSRMPARLRNTAVWLINQDVEPQLHQMNLKIKNVAGNENVGGIQVPPVVYQMAGTNGGTLPTLMGRPVVPVEFCATLGTVGDIMLVDLSQYLAIDKGGVESASSIHVRFLYNEQVFRFVYRVNGHPLWASAITPYKGSTTLSPFVVLQTR